jgi:hypothetical protein
MTTYAATHHATWLAGYNMTGDTNQTSLDITYDELDTTVFGNSARNRIAGLESVESTVAGLWQSGAGSVDEAVFTGLGSTVPPCTQSVSGAEGDVAWLWQPRKLTYSQGGKIGEVYPFELGMAASKSGGPSVGAVRGRVLKAPGDISATGVTGSVVQAGAVAADEYLYVVVHTFSIGTSFTLQIQSDSASNFPSATTQVTVGSITATGGTWATRLAGPITDDYWRVNVSAVSGTSSIAVAIGIK